MTSTTPAPAPADYESLGPRTYLDRLLRQYDLTLEELSGKVYARGGVPFWVGGERSDTEWFVHRSVLRSGGEFPCAGDAEALEFCRRVVDEMVLGLGVAHDEAVARVNRQWSVPADGGTPPRVWIVGLSNVYLDGPYEWARNIYYGHASRWWMPSESPAPLPPPE